MANRSYLYSLSNRPLSYDDRPETVSGLSEWAYDVPFIYRLLMSADPQLCASLVADGMDDDDADQKMRLYAISSPFAAGFARVERFADIVKVLLESGPFGAPPSAPAAAPAASFLERLKGMLPASSPKVVEAPSEAPVAVQHLPGWLDEMLAFLNAHRNEFLLLETVELDTMSEGEEGPLRQCVEAEIENCRNVGAAFAALPADNAEAAQLLRRLAVEGGTPPLDAFQGLRFDDDCDSTRNGATEHPMGLTNWSEVLYFGLFNRAEFEADKAGN